MTDTSRLPLSKPCTCRHTLSWHNGQGCTAGDCRCTAFTAPRADTEPTTPQPDPQNSTGPASRPTPRCPNCGHPMGDHSVRTPPRRTWCHACDTHCGHEPADTAEQAAPVDWQAIAQQRERELKRAGMLHEEHRRLLGAALDQPPSRPWPDLIATARAAVAGRRSAQEQVRDYEHRLSWETTCGEHAQLLDACRAADERADTAEAALARVRDAAHLHRQGLLSITELHAAIGPVGDNQSTAEDGQRPRLLPPGLVRQIRAAANATVGTDAFDRPDRAVRDFARDLERWIPEDAPDQAAEPDEADRIVAYRAPGSGSLYCVQCCDGGGMFAGLTSEDLPDGGLCNECEADVLIEPQPEQAAEADDGPMDPVHILGAEAEPQPDAAQPRPWLADAIAAQMQVLDALLRPIADAMRDALNTPKDGTR